MGGNIFDCKRITTQEYSVYKRELNIILNKLLISSDISVSFIPFIKEKQDHGDIDIVLGMKNVSPTLIKGLINNFFTDIKITSKDTLSILYKQVQVDLILIPHNKVHYAVCYFSYNDLGNLIGRLSKKLGFKHGHLGLFYKQMYNTTVVQEYCLSNNFYDILNILGLDIQTYKNGFDTYKEMFDYVISSPYFNSDIYLFENLNNKNRVRDKKRKTYNLFLNYITTMPNTSSRSLVDSPNHYVFTHFPHMREKVLNELNSHIKHTQIKKEIVSILRQKPYSLDGIELGKAIVLLKQNNLFNLPFNKQQINKLLKV